MAYKEPMLHKKASSTPIRAHLVCADTVLPSAPNHVDPARAGHHRCRAHGLGERRSGHPGVGEGVVAFYAAQAPKAIKAAHREQLQALFMSLTELSFRRVKAVFSYSPRQGTQHKACTEAVLRITDGWAGERMCTSCEIPASSPTGLSIL